MLCRHRIEEATLGFLKDIRRVNDLRASLPGLVDNAIKGQAQSAQQQVDQQSAMDQAAAAEREQVLTPALAASAANVTPEMLQPVAGMRFEDYVEVCRRAAGHTVEEPGVAALAATHGIDAAAWAEAYRGWNERIESEMSLASHFVLVYAGAGQ
jgi:hypothetical protein